MEIRFYDSNLNYLGLIENQSSVMWIRRYWEPGQFEVHMPATADNLRLGVRGNIVTYRGATEAGVIEDVTRSEQPLSREVIIKGRFLSSYMDRRLIKSTVNFSGKVEVAMRKLVSEAEPIPHVELGTLNNLSATVEFQATYRNLLSYLEKLSATSGYGFRFRPDFTAKKIYFEVYQGANRARTAGNTSFVEFSDDFDNIQSMRYSENDQLYRNVAYVGGQGQDDERIFVVIGDTDSTGLNRREVFIDARDVSANDLTDAEYRAALAQRGYEHLAEQYGMEESFECEVDPNSNFKYRIDYDLGDLVTVKRSGWVESKAMRITELQEVYENGSVTIIPTVGDIISTAFDTEDDSTGSNDLVVNGVVADVEAIQEEVDAVNTALTPQVLSVTDAGASGVSIATTRVVRSGNVVSVMTEITLTAAKTDWTTIMTGLPVTATGISHIWTEAYWSTSYTRPLRCQVNNAGEIQIRYGAANALYRLNTAYVCAE